MMRTKKISYRILLMMTVLPFLMVVPLVISEWTSYPDLMSIRRLTVLWRTVYFASIVALLLVPLGALSGYGLWRMFGKRREVLIALVGLLMIPPFFYAFLLQGMAFHLFEIRGLSGLTISLLGQCMTLLPAASLLFYLSFIHITVTSQQQMTLDTSIASVNRHLGLITLRSTVAPVVVLLFFLALADYTLPSIFAFNTYPVEIMSIYASTWLQSFPLVMALPLFIIIAIVLLVAKSLGVFVDVASVEGIWYSPVLPRRALRRLMACMLGFIGLMILITAFRGLRPAQMMETLVRYSGDFLYTLWIAIAAGALTAVCATLINMWMVRDQKIHLGVWLLMGFLAITPGTITGIQINSLYGLLPILGVFEGYLPAIHALFLRFLPYSFICVWIGFRQVPLEQMDALRLNSSSLLVLWHIVLKMSVGIYVALSGLIVMVMSFGELSAMLMIIAPGKSTVSVVIYNYLHYGSTETAAALTATYMVVLWLLMFVLLTVLFSNSIGSYKKKYKEEVQ